MKNKMLLGLLVSILTVSLMVAACGGQATTTEEPTTTEETTTSAPGEEVFHWRWQSAAIESEQEWTLQDALLEQLIEEGSGGRVQIDRYPLGVICGVEEIIDAVANGVIEMGDGPSGFAADRAPTCLATELPYGIRDGYEVYELHHAWGLTELMREEYAENNLYLLTPLYCGPHGLYTNFPINTVDDFNGKLAWLIPNIFWMQEFGLVPTEVPGWDLYMGMSLGTIDCFNWTFKGLVDYNLMEVTDYVMLPQLNAASEHVYVNLDAWNDLGPDLQRQIQDHIDAHFYKCFIEVDEYNAACITEAEAYGVEFVTLPPAEEAKLRAASRAYWDEVAAISPAAAEVVELYKAYLDYKGIPY